MEILYPITTLVSALAAIFAWMAKLAWSKEYSVAKDEVIKAKDAQIAVLNQQVKTFQEFTPMKMREYFLSVKEQLEEFVSELQKDLAKAKDEICIRQNEIERLTKMGEERAGELKKLEDEKIALQNSVVSIEGQIGEVPALQIPITPATVSSYLENAIILDGIQGSWKKLHLQLSPDKFKFAVDPVTTQWFWEKHIIQSKPEDEGKAESGVVR